MSAVEDPFGSATFGLVLVAGIWAAANVVYTAAQITNERRDAVLTGTLNGRPLTVEHRQLIMWSDWLPMALASCAFCIAFALFLICLPSLLSSTAALLVVGCALVATVPLAGGIALAASAAHEFQLMKRTLSKVSDVVHQDS